MNVVNKRATKIANSAKRISAAVIVAAVVVAGQGVGANAATGDIVEFSAPSPSYDITAGPDGNLWFIESNVNKIGRITPTGTVTEFDIPTAGDPSSITAGPDGNLWFSAPSYISKISRMSPT